MQPYFVKPIKVNEVEYATGISNRSTLVNHPINLSNCISIKKSRTAWYPDNNGIPSIVFEMMGKTEHHPTWNYKQEKDRDEDYEKLINDSK